jgi:hypothetical protein
MKDETCKQLKLLHSGEFHDLYRPLSILTKLLEARVGLTSNANILLKWKPLGKIPIGKVRRLQDDTRCVCVYIHTYTHTHMHTYQESRL